MCPALRRTSAMSSLGSAAGPCFACSAVVGTTEALVWLCSNGGQPPGGMQCCCNEFVIALAAAAATDA
eukprot:11223336-Lingulodinium_polyedra.AAC.1